MSTTEAPALVDGQPGTTGPGPSWSWQVDFNGPPVAEPFKLGVQWSQLPIGSQLEFTIPAGSNEQGSWGAIDSGQFTVENANGMCLVPADWPADVQTTMTIDWFQNGGPMPGPGATIEAVAAAPGS